MRNRMAISALKPGIARDHAIQDAGLRAAGADVVEEGRDSDDGEEDASRRDHTFDTQPRLDAQGLRLSRRRTAGGEIIPVSTSRVSVSPRPSRAYPAQGFRCKSDASHQNAGTA